MRTPSAAEQRSQTVRAATVQMAARRRRGMMRVRRMRLAGSKREEGTKGRREQGIEMRE
jgi:hypothetical protein